jgi:hypothetical protein
MNDEWRTGQVDVGARAVPAAERSKAIHRNETDRVARQNLIDRRHRRRARTGPAFHRAVPVAATRGLPARKPPAAGGTRGLPATGVDGGVGVDERLPPPSGPWSGQRLEKGAIVISAAGGAGARGRHAAHAVAGCYIAAAPTLTTTAACCPLPPALPAAGCRHGRRARRGGRDSRERR